MKKLMLAAMMMGMVAVTPVMAHASETEDTAVEAAMTEADENITQVLNWGENMEEEMAYKGYSGMFYTIDELNMRLMVPDGLEQRPRTEEEAANNIAVVFADEPALCESDGGYAVSEVEENRKARSFQA